MSNEYRLEKKSIKPNCRSSVFPGHYTISSKIWTLVDGDIEEITPEEIKDGMSILLFNSPFDFTKTSPTIKIEKSEGSYLIETETSIYELSIGNRGE